MNFRTDHRSVRKFIAWESWAGKATPARFVARVTNTGSITETFSLAASLPPGITGTFGQDTVEVPPGASNFRDVPLTLTPRPGMVPGSFAFTVSATATIRSPVMATADGTLDVLQDGVGVSLDPSSGAPGSTFQTTVTNTGMVTDTFDLALGGPAAAVASLGTNQVTLAPGASQVVPITTGPVNFAVQGALNLGVIATLHGNPAVQSGAMASLDIGATRGLASQLTPDTQTLPAPGTASFLLLVNNTGNTEDAYRAVITGTNGPVTATLMGLDGQPTQAIPLFRLPGLSTGALMIQTSLSDLGTGNVTVQVQSLSDAAMTASATASVTTQAVVAMPVATTTQLTVSPSPATVGQPVTLTAIVTPASGTGTPTGTVTFTIDGTAQAPVAVQVFEGKVQASLTTAMLGQGQHQVTASYSGDVNFTQSATATLLSLTVNPATTTTATTTQLAVSPSPATVGQPVTFTATVSPQAGAGIPTGVVTFTVDGVPQTALALQVVDGVGQASFTSTGLSAGPHTIVATYGGDAGFTPSTADILVQVVNNPPPSPAPSPSPLLLSPPLLIDGPIVTAMRRFGYHARPTWLVLTFDGPLDPDRARNPRNYRIVGPDGKAIGIDLVAYDPPSRTVTLAPQRRLNVHRRYRLTAIGTGPGGIASTSGQLLDGGRTGRPGSDFVATVDFKALVLGRIAPGGPLASTRSGRPSTFAGVVSNPAP